MNRIRKKGIIARATSNSKENNHSIVLERIEKSDHLVFARISGSMRPRRASLEISLEDKTCQ